MSDKAKLDYARPVTRFAVCFFALTVPPNKVCGARWTEFEDLDGSKSLWRIAATRIGFFRDASREHA